MAGGVCVRVSGTVWNTLEGGRTEKKGGETKILKRGQAGSRGGGTPLRTMPQNYVVRRKQLAVSPVMFENVFNHYHLRSL